MRSRVRISAPPGGDGNRTRVRDLPTRRSGDLQRVRSCSRPGRRIPAHRLGTLETHLEQHPDIRPKDDIGAPFFVHWVCGCHQVVVCVARSPTSSSCPANRWKSGPVSRPRTTEILRPHCAPHVLNRPLQHAADRRPRPPAYDHAVLRTAQPCADPGRRRQHRTNRAPAAASGHTGFKTGRVAARTRAQAASRTSPFAGTSLAERRRSRTYQPLGYNGLPVLKIRRVWLNRAVYPRSAPPGAPPAGRRLTGARQPKSPLTDSNR
jgi:hypothetical protein